MAPYRNSTPLIWINGSPRLIRGPGKLVKCMQMAPMILYLLAFTVLYTIRHITKELGLWNGILLVAKDGWAL